MALAKEPQECDMSACVIREPMLQTEPEPHAAFKCGISCRMCPFLIIRQGVIKWHAFRLPFHAPGHTDLSLVNSLMMLFITGTHSKASGAPQPLRVQSGPSPQQHPLGWRHLCSKAGSRRVFIQCYFQIIFLRKLQHSLCAFWSLLPDHLTLSCDSYICHDKLIKKSHHFVYTLGSLFSGNSPCSPR